jgi:Rad3-related DNA helicase
MSHESGAVRHAAILAAFARLGFTPRPGQPEAVAQVLSAFLDDGARHVVLCAPTGAGKSIIGAATAEALTLLDGGTETSPKASILLTATNVLASQYHATFAALEGTGQFMAIRGANNYECTALATDSEVPNAEACAFFTMQQNRANFEEVLSRHCDSCEYIRLKQRRNSVRHLATNYTYYFVDRLFAQKLEERNLVVWDEAHLVNDLFSDHNAIFFSRQQLERTAQEIAEVVGLTDQQIARTLKTIANDCAIKGKINERNYETYLMALLRVYTYAAERGEAEQGKALRAKRFGEHNKLTRFTTTYTGRACKIDDLIKYRYDHVFEYDEAKQAVTVKPIFVGNMFSRLQAARYNLFMSATISNEVMQATLNLEPSKTKFIKLPPTFPKENKQVIFYDPLPLSYATLQDPKTVSKLVSNIANVINKHVAMQERGIILAPSFKLQAAIVDGLPKGNYKLIEHRQGEKLEQALLAFKHHQGSPAVLISPSLFEGVDLPDDLSRFQVIVKAPFPSLADKRMKHILTEYPAVYNAITLMKLIQGAGRSVRSATDHATTYILDANAQRLFSSKANVWRDEFDVRFTKFI